MPRYALVLYPQNPQLSISDRTELVSVLSGLGFIDNELDNQPNAWYAGEQFLSLITFLGCSPFVRFKPDEVHANFTYISMPQPLSEPMLHAGSNSKSPRCPGCKQANAKYKTSVDLHSAQLTCEHCKQSFSIEKWNWRQSACFARETIWVWEVFEGEAVPGDSLLRALRQHTGSPWNYCYIAVSDDMQ